mmetsp:Transcript_20654/g.45122  ORF Transcript_20654/g.45122 Transcript_20654/m.45122 type:complete len:225 (-) Transcript_20654:744-1418(-)
MNSLIFGILMTIVSFRSGSAWVPSQSLNKRHATGSKAITSLKQAAGSLHGEQSCFLPLKQLDQDYYSPRIVQIAGAYPGLTVEEFNAVQSEEAPVSGQWTYDFSDPDGPQVGTVAIEGSQVVQGCDDPVAIIAEHPSLGVPLPETLTDPVDLIVLVDRARNTFAERKFLVIDNPTSGIEIGAFQTKAEIPAGSTILGHVLLVQIPWLPAMKPTKSGFMEEDEYF